MKYADVHTVYVVPTSGLQGKEKNVYFTDYIFHIFPFAKSIRFAISKSKQSDSRDDLSRLRILGGLLSSQIKMFLIALFSVMMSISLNLRVYRSHLERGRVGDRSLSSRNSSEL